MRIKLWGTRGSIPSPLRTEEIEAKVKDSLLAAAKAAVDLSNPTAVRAFVSNLPHALRGTAGGDTSCIEVRGAGSLIIFDCGSGMRRLGLELMKEEFGRGEGVAHIFMAHTHWDHMMGWPFFVPGYIPGNRFYIYGVHPNLEQRFRIQQTAPSMFPQPLDYQSSTIEFITLQESETVQIGQSRVSNMRFHHPGDSFGYRVEDDDAIFVYCGDAEYKTLDREATQHFVRFFRDADALVFDAMFSLHDSYRFEDWGHSSAVAGADLATRAGVRRLLLFHHNPASTDEEIWSLRDVAQAYLEQHPERPPCQVVVGYDGLELELWRESELETTTERRQNGSVVHLSGHLVEETASVALDAIQKAAEKHGARPLVVSLQAITHVDRGGLAALFSARRRWRPLALCGLTPEIRRRFAQADALEYFAIFEAPDAALEAMRQGLHLAPNRLLNSRYRIDTWVAKGPYGDVYRATDQATRRQVNILTICPSLGKRHQEALAEEAQKSSTLRHPLIAEVLGADQDGPIKYLVTEFTAGRSLRQVLEMETDSTTATSGAAGLVTNDGVLAALNPTRAAHIGSEIARALEYAHSVGMVHGGLAPEHVILVDDDAIKVANFGVGRLEINRPLNELPSHLVPLDYVAPEQLQGHGISPSADLYALGAVLYEMLTGQPPFASTDSDEDAIHLQIRQAPVPPRRRNPSLSRTLEHLVLNLLHKAPRQRMPSASIVRQALVSQAPQVQRKPFWGRNVSSEKLWHHLERVAQGQSGMLVIHGGRGVGKSQFVLSVTDKWGVDHPLKTLYAELFAYEDTRPFKPFVRVLRRSLLGLPAHVLSQLLDDLGDLSGPLTALIPDLRPALSTFAPSDIDCEGLEEAICQTLRLFTKGGAVVLILDSLQWVDVSSLRLLNRLARQRIPRLLIAALYRTEEVDQDHPLRLALDGLESWIDQQLHLSFLGPIEVHQMASSIGGAVPSDFGLWLYTETEGNPLHAEQLIQAYLEGPGETRHPRERLAARTVEDVVLRRLERLPDGTLATLRQAAVLGHNFRFDRLRAMLDEPPQWILKNLENSLQAGLILGHASEDRFSFAHPLIREVVYAEMLGGVRKRYHGRAAWLLEREGVSGQLDEKIDVLAHHFLHAGEAEKAVVYLARAIRRARQLCAFDDALHYVNLTLEVVDQSLRTSSDESELQQRRKQRDDLLAAQAKLEARVAHG